ncbi:homeobox protein 2 [Leptopilina boulardi]|uniref:homeobox protein 2 n=1 Tax=Leptopilina boulardi TaxID=63433 RepID=UPI0021F5C3B9|nr:homeobox protein 2 [Leptopilina boulardi]
MPEIQRTDSLRSAIEGGKASHNSTEKIDSLHDATSPSGWKPTERSVSFNRDVHVKRIGRGAPHVTAALVGDGEGRLITTPIHKESITSRSKEDLAQEAALVLQQADSVHCVAHDNRRLPGRFSTLPVRRKEKHSFEHPPPPPSSSSSSLETRRKSEDLTSHNFGDTPKPKKKLKTTLERSHSDASGKKFKNPIAKLFSPKLDRKTKPIINRSASDASHKSLKKQSESEHFGTARVKKQLSPIIEASPYYDQQPFHFGSKSNLDKKEIKIEKIIPISIENIDNNKEEKENQKDIDEVDQVQTMLHNSRYDQQHNNEESTIHKMIHRLSNDRSPPPQLTRTMVSPSPGFGHNNNRPFSYTRPNESSPPPIQNNVIYAQVQLDKKKAQRSHSDSDEGLGLDRKDSSRENSPAEKEYRRSDYYISDLRRNNEINNLKSRYENDFTNETDLFEKEKFTSTIFVDTNRGLDAKRFNNNNNNHNNNNNEFTRSCDNTKTSELSARRDLLESRIKSRLLADEMFATKKKTNNMEHEIIDKPIVPSPVTPNRVASPKRCYADTYITETRTSSNGEKYIFEKEIHEDNGKVYGYEKKINKIATDSFIEPKVPRDGYTVETRTDKYGDKYIVETMTHEGFVPEFKPFLSDKSRNNSDNRIINYQNEKLKNKYSKSEDILNRQQKQYIPKSKRTFEAIKGRSKSTQRLDEIGNNNLRNEYKTRSHENLTDTREFQNHNYRKFVKHNLDDLREGPNDDYDTDISQVTNSQLESKYYKETRTTQRYLKKHALHDDYDSSPPRVGYNSSRYDSDTTARDSIRCETHSSSRGIRKDYRNNIDDDPKKSLRRSRNRLDYLDDSDARESSRVGKISKSRLETFDEQLPPSRPPRIHHHHHHNNNHHESKTRHLRHETRGHMERRHRDTRLSDNDRKDRLADSGIENDYRRDSHEADSRREPLESEDEGFATLQFIKHERRHTDRNMNLTPAEKRKYDKYVIEKSIVTTKPPSGADKKYEKKAVKKSGTMSKVKQLFSKKEKKAKEEQNKKNYRISSSGALTDDEVTTRYREYRGDQLRSARSVRDLGSDFNQDDYSQRRRLSTPSGSPSPPQPSRLSRSTGTLTREEEPYKNTLTRDNQGQEAERKGWFKSLSRKTKSNSKPIDKKPRIPESEILTTGTEDEEASSAPERASVQKNLRFFGDTDQESISSNLDRRNKRNDDHASTRRDVTNSSRRNLGIITSPRKPSRLNESALSSGESTTGDSSQQSQNSQRSQRSVVYLHAATVGEIPGPNERRRAASREELNRPLQAHTRTVSRSVSVLAPWRPKHYREPFEINYDQQQHQKPMITMKRRQRSRETLSRRGKDPRRSKDNLSKTGTMNRSTLKSKDKQKVDRTVSTESLASKSRSVSSRPELNRSTSVPRDPNKSAGWFKLKSKKSRS